MVAVGDADPAVTVATLRQALEAVARLSAERAGLEEALKVCTLRFRSGRSGGRGVGAGIILVSHSGVLAICMNPPNVAGSQAEQTTCLLPGCL